MVNKIRGIELLRKLEDIAEDDLHACGLEYYDGEYLIDGAPVDPDRDYDIWNTANPSKPPAFFDGSADWSVGE